MIHIKRLALAVAVICTFAVQAMQQPLKQLIITNRSGQTIEVRAGVDNAVPVELHIYDNQQHVVPFRQSVDLLQVQSVGAMSREALFMTPHNYSQEIQAEIQNNPQHNIEVTVLLPTGYTSLVSPYTVRIDAVQGFLDLGNDIPQSGRIADYFRAFASRQAAAPAGARPTDSLKFFEIFDIDEDASFPTLTANYRLKRALWDAYAQDPLTPPVNAQFARDVVDVYDNVYALMKLEDEFLTTRRERRGMGKRLYEQFMKEHEVGKAIMLPMKYLAEAFGANTAQRIQQRRQQLDQLLQ